MRLNHPQPAAGVTMMPIAIAGLVANLFSFWLLHLGSEEKNLNVRAAVLHMLDDLLGSVGAVVAVVVIMVTNWTPVEPIFSVLVSTLVLCSAWRSMKESVNELLEGVPASLDIGVLQRHLRRAIPEVRDVHHVHVWQVGEKPLMKLHVQVIPLRDCDNLLGEVHHFLAHYYGIAHATVQMEYQSCSLNCRLGKTAPDYHTDIIINAKARENPAHARC